MNKLNKIFLLLILLLTVGLFNTACDNNNTNQEEVYHEVWVYDEDSSDFYNVLDGEAFSYSNVAGKADYVYDGLYLDAEYQNKYDETTPVKSDLTLYVHYVKEKMIVTFNANGGSGGTTKKVKYNTACTAPNSTPIKLYAEFVCWCTDADGNNPFDFTTLITEDITLYAKYKEVSYDGIIDEYIPDVVDQNINFELPDSALNYIWTSSDENRLSSTGTYLPGRTDQEVTVTLTITAGAGESVSYSKKTLVKGYTLPELEIGNVVIGYSSSWYLGEYTNGYSSEILSTCNVINLCFAYVTPEGGLKLSEMTSFPRYITECHKNGIRVLLSVQGSVTTGSADDFATCAKSETLRKKLAASMAQACVDLNLDGIDIDWEYPVGEQKYTFTYLMEEIRTALDNLGDDYLLTSAIPGGNWGAGTVELTKVAQIFDYINMMTYDLEGTETGSHHTALYKSDVQSGTRPGAAIEEAVEQWHNDYNVPYNKIVIGCAFYAKPGLCNSTTNPKVLGNVKTTTQKNIRYSLLMSTYFSKFGTEGNWYAYDYDESSEAPYIYNFSTTAKIKAFITYDNERSVIAKGEYAKKTGLCGVMIWELGEDNTNYLITSVAQGMGRHIDGKPYVIAGSQTFKVGQEITIKAVEELEQAAYTITYGVSDNTIASITDKTCKFLKAGNVTISVFDSDGNCLQSMNVTVTN